VMFSVSDKRLRYCKQHWLDIAIILLPFISFLRSLRIVRATRVARLARVEQLVRMSRLYRLRGLAMRALRAMLLLKLLNRLFKVAPDKQLRKLREELRERETDVRAIKRQIVELERAIAQLPPSYRRAFLLHDVEGLEHHEIGETLGIAEGTSKSLLFKARMRLRVILRGRPGER